MNPHRPAVECAGGFTLVELVIVIALTGVVAVLASTMVGNQMLGYVDTARRAELMAKANMAMQHIARDLRGPRRDLDQSAALGPLAGAQADTRRDMHIFSGFIGEALRHAYL